MKANDEIKKVSWIKTNWLFLLIGVTIGGYLLWAIWYWQCHPSEAGQFGDMFGAVTSILTFLSVFLLIKSIKLQSEELQNSSKALKHSASELELTRKEFQKQNDTSYQQLKTNKLLQQTTRKQRIEATFFNLIQLHQNSPKFRVLDELKTIHYTAFSEHKQNEFTHLSKVMGTDQINYYVVNDASIDLITERYNTRNRSDNSAIYYQIALSILEYLKDVDLSNESTQKLVYIFRSLLSQEELLILFYYMKLHRQFNNKFVDSDIFDFAMKYHLFENVDASMFPNLTIKSLFDIKRYK